jgi:cysteine-rich CPCC protein
MRTDQRYPCPCCGFLTLEEVPPGSFEICPVCWWEDDAVQYAHPDMAGGANRVSLNEARENVRRIGASEPEGLRSVRPPKPDEIPKESAG